MTTFIEYTQGKVYDLAYLRRPKDQIELIALARAGHPCAHIDGGEVRLIRRLDDIWCYDRWMLTGGWQSRFGFDALSPVHLAPLAVKDGRPLHVGDVIEFAVEVTYFGGSTTSWRSKTIQTPETYRLMETAEIEWRWPMEVK